MKKEVSLYTSTPEELESSLEELRKNQRKNLHKDGNIMTSHKGADKWIFGVAFVIFALQCFTIILPFAWMIMSSFKEVNEYNLGGAFSLPTVWEFENYTEAFQSLNDPLTGTSFFGLIFNSIWYTVLTAGMASIVPSVTGYVISKYRFPGRDFIYAVAIVALTIPIVGSGAASMKLWHQLNLYDNPLRVVVGGLGGFGGTFLVYYGFFKSVSWSYAEAAEIDGAGPYTVFFQIMLPQAVPIILTYMITGAIGAWNEYQSIILYQPSFPTLASGLFNYKSNTARADIPVYYAGLVISMIPTLVLFSLCSSKIMTSISIGGLKG